MEKIYKRGDYNEDKTKIFSHYRHSGKMQWYSVEAWNRRKQKQKEFLKTEKSKIYQKEWYEKNRSKKLIASKTNRKIRNEEFPLKSLLSTTKLGSKKRNFEYSIDIEFILNQWDKQQGLCYYTKVPMLYTSCKKDPFQVSIDRIDSSKGYTPENTVLCCQSINYMKNDYPLEKFIEFLNSVKHYLL